MLSFEILIYTYIVLQMIRKENSYLLKKNQQNRDLA